MHIFDLLRRDRAAKSHRKHARLRAGSDAAGGAVKCLAAFVTLSAAPLPISAQTATETETGSIIPIPRRARIPDGSDKNIDAARIVAANFARCVVARNPKGVARAIDLPPGPLSSKAMTALATSECLDSGQMTIPQRVMRGALFVELYRVREVRKVDIAARRPLDLNNEFGLEYQQDPCDTLCSISGAVS